MKRIFIIVLLIGLFVPLNCSGQTSNLSDQISGKIIDSFVAKQEKATLGQEYREGRKLLGGKLRNFNINAVLFTIEGIVGANNSSQFLAVFVKEKGKFVFKSRVQVGGKGIRFAVDFNSIEDDVIQLDTKEYLASDALCCPSGKGKAQYAFVGNNLIELSTR